MKRTTTIAIVILLVLTGVWWLLRDEPVTRVEAPYTVAAIDDLQRIEISHHADSDLPGRIVLHRQDGTWRLTAPVDSALAQGMSERVDRAFAGSIRTDDLRLDPAQAANYDLDAVSAVGVKLFGAGDALRAELEVGKEISVPQTGARRTYIRPAGTERIYRAQAEFGNLLRTDLDDWRDRRIVTVGPESLQRLEIAHGDGQVLTVHKGDEGQWSLSGAGDLPASATKINTFVNYVARARVDRYVEKSVAETGLDAADLPRLVIGTDDGTRTIVLGAHVDGDEGPRYARFADKDEVFVLNDNNASRLFPRVEGLTEDEA
jgi:hypothetical protein